jgi:tRNA U34 5-methylaminomethyl-2-thiouridine-forming methyltransferase MnmC
MIPFEIVITTMGATSIRDNRVNEIMHNPVGPWAEANALYVDQPQLRVHLRGKDQGPLVIFDVGLGAAANAIAAMAATLEVAERPLHLISFENNLALLKFALQHAALFDHMKAFTSAIESLLEKQFWKSPCGLVTWELRAEDFLTAIETETNTADLIFFDPYSPNVDSEIWTLSCFEKLRSRCHGPEANRASRLYTYSRATPVRAALLLAGFYAGQGDSTGLKPETTQASTHLNSLARPLDARWYLRWQRSHTQLPFGSSETMRKLIQERMKSHPQFRGLS